jgi:hypothetical protein
MGEVRVVRVVVKCAGCGLRKMRIQAKNKPGNKMKTPPKAIFHIIK